MNKSDIKLLIIILIIILIVIILLNLCVSKSKSTNALVYYDNKLILTIDLSINNEYIVDGFNGDVVIEVKDNNIRVKNETSPKHLCSKQGFISKNYETIICLPNKIIIKMNNNDLDGVVK